MYLKNSFISLIIVSFLMASIPAYAQTTTSTTGRFTILDKGDKAPFDGVLYDLLGNAVVLTDKEQTDKNRKLDLGELKEHLEARHEPHWLFRV